MMQHIDFTSHQYERVTPGDYRKRAQAVIGTGGWSAAMDLLMLETLLRGEGINAVGALLVVPPHEAKARWFTIQRAMTCRDFLPFEAQSILLDELRAAVRRGMN